MGLILAIDVGKGTEDILIFDADKTIENSIQGVFPSTAQLLTKSLSQILSGDIVISGELMAGEPWHKEVYRLAAEQNSSVTMSYTAAKSLRYNLDQVRAKGINIVADNEIGFYSGIKVKTQDINWQRIQSIIEQSEYSISDISTVLLCCQDHGIPPNKNQSTRDFRMKVIYQDLNKNGKIEDLLSTINNIPHDLPRHLAIGKSALNHFSHLRKEDIFVMDSSPAVILGSIDNQLQRQLVVNVGNGHTLAVFLKNQKVELVYEIHTGGVTTQRLESDLHKILKKELTHDQSLKEGGHGIFLHKDTNLDKMAYEDYLPGSVIGPNRKKLVDLNFEKVHPGGSMMMAGPIGLLRAFKFHNPNFNFNK